MAWSVVVEAGSVMLIGTLLGRHQVRGRVDPAHDPRHETLIVALQNLVQSWNCGFKSSFSLLKASTLLTLMNLGIILIGINLPCTTFTH